MRRRRRYYEDDSLERLMFDILVLVLLGLVSLYLIDRPRFFRWIAYITGTIIGLIVIAVLWREFRARFNRKHLIAVLDKLRSAGQEGYLKDFINTFGLENPKIKGWSYRNHNFEWDRINDLKKILKEAGVTHNEKDVFAILRFYIQEKEEKFTRESMHREPQKFATLSGEDFEKLLYRLFEKMGYLVKHYGQPGDQGGDLVASKNGEHMLIQAKRYLGEATGNAAVQQVVAAAKFYNCSKTMVVTTSYFTPEAITLAKVDGTELVSGERLKELLLQYLGESWT